MIGFACQLVNRVQWHVRDNASLNLPPKLNALPFRIPCQQLRGRVSQDELARNFSVCLDMKTSSQINRFNSQQPNTLLCSRVRHA